MNRRTLLARLGESPQDTPESLGQWLSNYTKTAPRRCANTVAPRGLADDWSID